MAASRSKIAAEPSFSERSEGVWASDVFVKWLLAKFQSIANA